MMRSSPHNVRCPTGHAVVTGPNDYHKLHVPYVIHAVGPNYWDFGGQTDEAHQYLINAYHQSLDRAVEQDIQRVGFSLLSAGIFRAQVPLLEILEVTMYAIQTWVPESAADEDNDETEPSKQAPVPAAPTQPALLEVTLCGFNKEECQTLVHACKRMFRPTPVQESHQAKKAKSDKEEEPFSDAESQDVASPIYIETAAVASEAVGTKDFAVAGAKVVHTVGKVVGTANEAEEDEEWEVLLELEANAKPVGPKVIGSDDDSL